MESGNQSISLGSGPELPVAPSLSSNTTIIQCPKCSSQRFWKDGLRYTHEGQVQRYLCRVCGLRFSHSEHSEPFEAHQRIHRLILNCSPPKELSREHDTGFKTEPLAVILKSSVMGSKIRRDTCNQHEAVNEMESRTQEQAAGATANPSENMKGKLVEYSWWLQKEGYSPSTIIGRAKLLKVLVKRGADLYDPESVKDVIAKQKWSEGRKDNAADAYSSFLQMTGGKWQRPKYKGTHKIPFIPTETELDQLIAACSARMGTFLQLLKETGIRSGEAWNLTWQDLDIITKTVRITPEKGSNPRIFHISTKLAAMFESLPKTYGDRVFSKPQMRLDHHGRHLALQRKRIASKLKNPRLLRITFHTLRHFKGTMEYHKTKDVLHVMQTLGHKNIQNTLIYVQLAEALFQDQQEYVSKIAKTEKDACSLIDAGFEFVCDFNGAKLFRKRKY